MSDESSVLSLDRIMDVGRKLLELRPLQEVLDGVTSAAIETMHAENALIILRDSSDGNLRIAAGGRSADGRAPSLDTISRSLIDDAMLNRRPVLSESAREDPRFLNRTSVILQHILAAAVVPLVSRGAAEGVIYLDSRSDRDLFREENLGPLANLAAFAMLAIDNARRFDHTWRALEDLKRRNEMRRGELIGSAPAMQELYAMLERVARTELPVFVEGESGTGKELVAREIHSSSSRQSKPFLPLYCGNVSPQIFESELFGHKIGAFTGAIATKPGLVDAVQGGTLFLDEVADIPLELQPKVLRFLQNGEYRAVGDTVTHHADVRVIAATNKKMQTEISEGRFREDLYFRLYILPLWVPPLRERSSDIPLLTRHFLTKGRRSLGGPTDLTPEALRHLMNHPWPGNVRELENTITRARVVAQGGLIGVDDLVHSTIRSTAAEASDLSWQSAERRHVTEVLRLCDGNKSRAAKVLGVSRRYLYYKLEEWQGKPTTGAK